MIRLKDELKNVKTVAISGHIRPDGDCIGSCLGVWNYIRDNYPDIRADVYLEQIVPKFRFLKGADEVKTDCSSDASYDLFIALDASDRERLGEAVKYLDTAKRSVCVDHHITNPGFATENWVVADASSASELAWETMEEEKISKNTAEALYMGIAHDTGVFQYSNTSPKTMQIAGSLIAKGIPFSQIIDETFYKKTYIQNQILGRALVESILMLDGRVIIGRVRQKDMEFYGAIPADLDGIVSQLRVTDGVEVAIFLYETGNHQYKASLRSNGDVDVSAVCAYFGGGGHVKAAGCTMYGTVYDVINNLTLHIEKQLDHIEKQAEKMQDVE